jgi:hypothetical protein
MARLLRSVPRWPPSCLVMPRYPFLSRPSGPRFSVLVTPLHLSGRCAVSSPPPGQPGYRWPRGKRVSSLVVVASRADENRPQLKCVDHLLGRRSLTVEHLVDQNSIDAGRFRPCGLAACSADLGAEQASTSSRSNMRICSRPVAVSARKVFVIGVPVGRRRCRSACVRAQGGPRCRSRCPRASR